MDHPLRVTISILVARCVVLTGLALEDITAARACGNVRYKNYQPKSELRVHVESALAAKDWAQLKQGLYKKAVKRLERARKHAVKDYKVYSTLGTALEKTGNYKAAEAALATAVRLNPKAHQGMEWVHLEVVRFRIQLAENSDSASTAPFLHAFANSKSAAVLTKARKFARTIAPDLRLD